MHLTSVSLFNTLGPVPSRWFSRSLHTCSLNSIFSLLIFLSYPPPLRSGQDPLSSVTHLIGTMASGLLHVYSPVRIFRSSQTLLVFLLLSSCGSLSMRAWLSALEISVYGAPQFSPQPYQLVTVFIPILWMRKLGHNVWSHACGLIGWRVDNSLNRFLISLLRYTL